MAVTLDPQREVIKFLFLKGVSAASIRKMIVNAYRSNVLDVSMVR